MFNGLHKKTVQPSSPAPAKLSAQHEKFMDDTKAALLAKSTPVARAIIYTVISLLIISIIWAYFAELDDITVADGKVIPSSEVKVIQSLDGGIVSEILVEKGEVVKNKQIIARLDDTRYKADYADQFAKYLALGAMVARLDTEAHHDANITFPVGLNNYPGLLARENKLFITRKKAIDTELASMQVSYDLALQEVQMYTPLVAKGYVSVVEYLHAKRTANDIKIAMLQKENDYYTQVKTDLNQHQAELESLQESLNSLRDKIVHTVIRSPVNGIVKKIVVNTIGGVVPPTSAMMEIVPIDDTLLIEAKIRPSDIAFIYPGAAATVKITAYDYSIYGSLAGKVNYISADSIEENNRVNEQQSPSYYHAQIRTQRNYLGSDKHQLPIMPGMVATVHIKTGKKTVLQYLLKPLIKAKQEALRER